MQFIYKLKGYKLPGVDKIDVEYLKRGRPFVLEWLVRMFNWCMHEGRVAGDRKLFVENSVCVCK